MSELEQMVVLDMIVEGFNPLNKDDVDRYWASKGIVVDG